MMATFVPQMRAMGTEGASTSQLSAMHRQKTNAKLMTF
jgi:hypothetical protein